MRTRTVERHLPAIATFCVIVWLCAVCLSIGRAPASAQHVGPLVKAALGGRAPTQVLEERSRPVVADLEPADTNEPGSPDDRGKNEKDEERDDRPRGRDLGHTVPVPPRLASLEELKEPHHDYPALDIALDTGTRVVAVTSGYVRATTKWGACGKGVIIEGEDNFTYTYCHGSKLLVGRGRTVSEGQGVIRSGNTGDSTGPHLHLQIRRPNGNLVCPQDLLPAWQKGVPKSPWEAGRRGCHTGSHGHSNKKKRR